MSNLIRRIVVISILFISMIPCRSKADIPIVYKITTSNCQTTQQASTGFSVEYDGNLVVITALHGVLGCQFIAAMGDKIDVGFKCLKIDQVDIEHDVALLVPCNENKKCDGECLQPSSPSPNYKGLYVIGYPHNLEESIRSNNLTIRHDRPVRQLNTLVTGLKCPDENIDILSIEGHLTHGHSGSPLLNGQNLVVGVANGGVQDGETEIVWGIPWHDIDWKSYEHVKEKAQFCMKQYTSHSFSAFKMNTGNLIEWQEPKAGYMTWAEARDYVKTANTTELMGFDNWRLPKIGELKELAEFIKQNPGVYSDVDLLYWSNEDQGRVSLQGYVVNLGNAKMPWTAIDDQVVEQSKNKAFAVRLVRNVF